MANRFIGGVLSSKPQANSPFVSRATTGTYFNSSGIFKPLYVLVYERGFALGKYQRLEFVV